jgi:hypothetical protein
MPDYNTFDLIDLTVDEKPAEVSVAFDELIGQRIVDIIAQKKVEVAQQMFGPQDSEDDDIEYEDDESEDDDDDEDYDDSDLDDLDSEEEEDENS